MRIIKLQDGNHYYCHLKKLLPAMLTNILGTNTPNLIVIEKVDDRDVDNAYAMNQVTILQ